MARVRLISGGPRSDRAAHIDDLLIERLHESLLVVPSALHARRRAGALLRRLGRGAFLDPAVITFEDLVKRIMRHASSQARMIDYLEQRLILRKAVERSRSVAKLGAVRDSEGLIDHLLSVIDQLKQAAVEPAQFAERTRNSRDAMDRIVAEVYAVYQEELLRSNVVDRPGLYWLARIECERKKRPILSVIRRLLFDAFDDFTPSEFAVIKALERHADEFVFGLNYGADPQQQNLYALALKTAQAIRDAFETVDVGEPCEEMAPTTQSQFLAATFFIRSPVAAAPKIESDVEFNECHTLEHEIETIARRIKHLVRNENTTLPEIAVVWRNPGAFAGPMREIFREFEIPLSGLEEQDLTASAIAGFVLRFLDAMQSWSLDGVVDVLTSPWFAGPQPHAETFPLLANAARIQATARGWRGGLRTLLEFLGDPKQIELKRLAEHLPQARAACESMLNAFDRFVTQAESISRTATISEFVAQVQKLIEQWPLVNAIGAMPASNERELEEAALQTLHRTLGVLSAESDNDTKRQSRTDFAQMLRRAFSAAPVRLKPTDGAVQCLGMEPARYLEFDYVFLAGMTDTQVPARRALNAIYSDDERNRLGSMGVRLDSADVHNQREVLLFQRMFLTARKRLFVSWHRRTGDGAIAQRSLYLNEILDRVDKGAIQKPASAEEILLPRVDLAGCVRDLQNLAIRNNNAQHFPAIAASARIERRRYSNDDFDMHDGMPKEASNLAWLQGQFGEEHPFSASQLETYADCPFRFFQERVLDLLVIEPPEQAFDHLARGAVLHDALEKFHKHYLESGKTIAEIYSDDEAATVMERFGEAAFDAVAAQFRNLSPGVLAAERARLLAQLQRHVSLQRNSRNDAPWIPSRLELEFGGKSELPLFSMDTEHGLVRLQGKIDRIDARAGAYRLIDYKSSKVQVKRISEGKVFQLPLYALACEAMPMREFLCEEAAYVGVGKEKSTTFALSRDEKRRAPWDERMTIAREKVAKAVDGIRRGVFHPTTDQTPCTGCLRQKACRFERARIQRKVES